MKIEESELWLLLGSSRGLGSEFLNCAQGLGRDLQLITVSRKPNNIVKNLVLQFVACDLSKPADVSALLESELNKPFQRMLYFAGGGPYGSFTTKEWKDHEWAWNVTFMSAAHCLYKLMQRPSLKQAIFIGSQIAENTPDPGAASYASAKHALRGLITTLQKETISTDLRLFSPGYMNTTLLPKSAHPRQNQKTLWEPSAVAQELLLWMQDSNMRGQNWSKCSL